MMPFKNHKKNSPSLKNKKGALSLFSGFAYIEIMVTVALLAVFGTNLFVTQAHIFSNIRRTHRTLLSDNISTLDLPEFFLKIINLTKDKKPIESIELNKEYQQYNASLKITLNKLSEKSAFLKNFKDIVQIIDKTVQFDQKQYSFKTFLFTPPPPKEDEAKDKEQKTSDAKTPLPKGGALLP